MLYKLMLLISLPLLLTACGNDEKGYEVLIFTEEISSETTEEEITEVLVEMLPHLSEENFSVIFHLAVADKFFMEAAAQHGDLMIADEYMLEAVMDPEGLVPLEESITANAGDIPADPYQQAHPDTGEMHYYAVPLNQEMRIFKELEISMEEPVSAFIPAYSEHQELSSQVLEKIMEAHP